MEFSPLLIPIFGMMIPIVAITLKHREKVEQMRLDASKTAPALAQRDDGRMEMLEDRVAVLERIITDKGYDVATQIEALRDHRRVDDLLDARRERNL